MRFILQQDDLRALIPTSNAFDDGHCECWNPQCPGGWTVFITFAGFKAGASVPRKPEPPTPQVFSLRHLHLRLFGDLLGRSRTNSSRALARVPAGGIVPEDRQTIITPAITPANFGSFQRYFAAFQCIIREPVRRVTVFDKRLIFKVLYLNQAASFLPEKSGSIPDGSTIPAGQGTVATSAGTLKGNGYTRAK